MIIMPANYTSFAYPLSAAIFAVLALITYLILKEYRIHRCFIRCGKGNLSINESRMLSLGLIYAEEKRFYADSLTTGLKDTKLDLILKDDWGITNRESALMNLQMLCASGDRMNYIEILPYLEDNQKINEYFREQADNDRTREMNMQLNLIASLSEHFSVMQNHFIFPFDAKSISRGIMAWDTSRLVALVRMSYDKKFITEIQAWRYISDAYDMAYLNYQNWREYAIGYLIGSAMRQGSDVEHQEKITGLAENALTNRESPWNIMKFKSLS